MKEMFSFKKMRPVAEDAVAAFRAVNSQDMRRVPLVVAGEVYAGLEDELTTPGAMDAGRLAAVRGGMIALRLFALKWQGLMAEVRR